MPTHAPRRKSVTGPYPRSKTRRAEILQRALDRHHRSRAWAAEQLGIAESTLCRNLARLQPQTRSLKALQELLLQLGESHTIEDLR